MIVVRGKKLKTLYMTEESNDTIVVAKCEVDSKLWQQKLQDISKKEKKLLVSKEQLSNLKDVDVGLCKDCIYDKQKRVSFSKVGR